MKRSEMVNTIISTIEQACGYDGEEQLYPPDEYLAEVILRAIEAAGMQPPKLRHYVLPDGNPEFAYMEWVNKWES
jgi:hypothetical protein